MTPSYSMGLLRYLDSLLDSRPEKYQACISPTTPLTVIGLPIWSKKDQKANASLGWVFDGRWNPTGSPATWS